MCSISRLLICLVMFVGGTIASPSQPNDSIVGMVGIHYPEDTSSRLSMYLNRADALAWLESMDELYHIGLVELVERRITSEPATIVVTVDGPSSRWKRNGEK